MKDIARLAQVSTSTVSHVINQSRYVSPEITEKVNQAAKALNYAPSALARSLKMNRTQTIGMLMTNSTNPFFGEVVKGVERSCYQQGYNLIVCNTEGDTDRMKSSINTLLQKRVDGLLLMCATLKGECLDILERYPDIPVVAMDWGPIGPVSAKIQDNSFDGGYLATNYLIESGHTQIGCITGPLQHSQAQMRYQGYRKAMQEAGLEPAAQWIVESDFECEGGADALKQMYESGSMPSAIFVCNDIMAMGVMSTAHHLGLRIPEDLSIIGYDDIHFSRFMSPPLTTIHQPKYRLGKSAVELVVSVLQDQEKPPSVVQLAPTLTVRETVKVL